MKETVKAKEPGFSLVELLIAMVVTLVISGAIYALIASGQASFKREPEITDMQQNLRVAMSLIQRDIAIGGMGIPAWRQVFSRLDAVPGGKAMNGHGPNSTGLVAQADGVKAAINPNCPVDATGAGTGAADPGDSGCSDWLEIWGNDGLCPTLTACKGDTGSSVTTFEGLPPCLLQVLPGPVLLSGYNACVEISKGGTYPDGSLAKGAKDCPTEANVGATQCEGGVDFLPAGVDSAVSVMWADPPGGAKTGSCDGVAGNGHAVFPHGQAPAYNPPGGPLICVQHVLLIQVVLYQVAPDPADGVPSLWRTVTGTTGVAGKGQMVARGIEDMQIHYLDGSGVWQDLPKTLASPNYDDIVRQVRVTLSARTTGGAKLQGASKLAPGANAPMVIREQMTTIGTPRAALIALEAARDPVTGSPAPKWH